jgi:hypothetical protein
VRYSGVGVAGRGVAFMVKKSTMWLLAGSSLGVGHTYRRKEGVPIHAVPGERRKNNYKWGNAGGDSEAFR